MPLSLSLVAPLSLPRFEVPCYVVFCACLQCFSYSLFSFNTLSTGYQEAQPVARVSCRQPRPWARVSKVRIPFPVSHLATAAKVIGLATTTTARAHDVLMMDYRLGLPWNGSAKPLPIDLRCVLHYANSLQILVDIGLETIVDDVVGLTQAG